MPETNHTSDAVTDDETVYRSVRANNREYHVDSDGNLRVSSSAFNDPGCQPSVDRAKLRNNRPELAKRSPTDGILSLVAREIRNESVSMVHGGKGAATLYTIDVKADPIEGNNAHALIIPSPTYKNESAFKKVKEKLAALSEKAGWTVKPQES